LERLMASGSSDKSGRHVGLTGPELTEAALSGAALGESASTGGQRSKVGRILDAAASVFARRGFNEARMDEVAEEAGVSKGGLYLHFASKDALFEGLVGYLVGMETRKLATALSAEGPVADRLAGFFHEYARDLLSMARFYPIVMEVYARSYRHASLRKALHKYVDAYVTELSTLIREGIACGEFREVDAEDVAFQLISLLEGLALLWGVDPDRAPMPDVADRGVRLILDGLLVRPASSAPGPASGAGDSGANESAKS
jgi:AcrR family transcriptional regulator